MARVDPLTWNMPIVDDQGRPTPEFMRKWAQQANINGQVPADAATMSAALDLIGSAANSVLIRGATKWGIGQATDLLDKIGNTRGSLLYRGATGWQIRTPSAANKILVDGGAGADPAWNTLTALLDALFSSAQGAVLYRDASGWAALGPGTAGQFLQTAGAGANPLWAAASGGGGAAGGDFYNPPTGSGWSVINGGSGLSPALAPAINYDSAHGLTLTTGASYTSSNWYLCAATVAAVSSSAITVTERLRIDLAPDANSFTNTGGLVLSDGTKYLLFGWYLNATNLCVHALPSANAGASHTVVKSFATNSMPFWWIQDFYVRVIVSGGNVKMLISRDGVVWTTLFDNFVYSTYLSTIATVGFGICPARGTAGLINEGQGMTCLYFTQTTP